MAIDHRRKKKGRHWHSAYHDAPLTNRDSKRERIIGLSHPVVRTKEHSSLGHARPSLGITTIIGKMHLGPGIAFIARNACLWIDPIPPIWDGSTMKLLHILNLVNGLSLSVPHHLALRSIGYFRKWKASNEIISNQNVANIGMPHYQSN